MSSVICAFNALCGSVECFAVRGDCLWWKLAWEIFLVDHTDGLPPKNIFAILSILVCFGDISGGSH